ncbi:conserved hypothetical protein [Hyphomonas neptunium ATCC 15444]|uniref:DUF2891 domain-containing protein n=1 Tax=Hyphomonas neptunium (strain ATCC 15444) TaxID=228405 RepID=Q0C0B9_HYPNA|nr:conserved hypothetical protein [Hyphomonas neptunium ATCC 15444]
MTDRFARLALSCVHKDYPNKISHVLNSAADAATPRELYPAFYGCFDWHSSVHGHWLLVRILNTDPETPYADAIKTALAQSFSEENIAGEVAYFQAPDRASFERPYGTAWFLQLMTELREADFPEAAEWAGTLAPLETLIADYTSAWLPKLVYPIRAGTHNQTAFAFGLMIDWADATGNTAFREQIAAKSREFYSGDVSCPLGYEPSGEDFLSPCLMEADLMRRVMDREAFAAWLTAFLPLIPQDGNGDWLAPGVVLDPSDGKLVHLDGLNLSRAWALEGIASALPEADPRRPALLASAALHKETGVASVSEEHYAGSHWLASFATYLETRRGLSAE